MSSQSAIDEVAEKTAAMTIEDAEEFPILSPQELITKFPQLVLEMKSENKVKAINALGIFYTAVSSHSEELDEISGALSKHVPALITHLATVSLVSAVNEKETEKFIEYAHLSMAAAAMLCKDDNKVLFDLLKVMAQRLKEFSSKNSSMQTEDFHTPHICLLVDELTSLLREQIAPYADELVMIAISLLECKNSSPETRESALCIISFCADGCREKLAKYIQALSPHLVSALKETEDNEMCMTAAVNLVSSLCFSLEDKIAPLADDIMTSFLQTLQNPRVDRDVKPRVIAAIGDLAIAVKGHFSRYLLHVGKILQQAGQVTLDVDDGENVEYLNNLAASILDAYSAIVQGMRSSYEKQSVLQFASDMIQFATKVHNFHACKQPLYNTSVFEKAVMLVGNLASNYNTEMKTHYRTNWTIKQMLEFACKSEDKKLQSCGKMVEKMLL